MGETKQLFHTLAGLRVSLSKRGFFLNNIDELTEKMSYMDGVKNVDYNQNNIHIFYNPGYLKERYEREGANLFIPSLYDDISIIVLDLMRNHEDLLNEAAADIPNCINCDSVLRSVLSGHYNNYIGYLYQIQQVDSNLLLITF